jgi:hypothetical protein
MNERINELAGQAKFMAEEDINKQISYNAELKAFAEKFAELIVLECASAVNSRDDSDTGFWANIIKEHFGVKE